MTVYQHAMSQSQATNLGALSALADKIALELVFAEAGSDNGLLPINSFIAEMEQTADVPGTITEAIAKGRGFVDDIFLSTGQFTRETIDRLSTWVPWVQAVISAVSQGRPLPAFDICESSPASEVKTVPKTDPKPDDEQALTLNLAQDRELLQEFANESREHLQNIETGVLTLEVNPADADTLNSIFRAFHTFKGGSGFLNLTPINKLAHELESLLDLARQTKIQITPEVIEVILSGGDCLRQFIDTIQAQLSGDAPEGPIVIPTEDLRHRIAAVIAGEASILPNQFEGQTAFIKRAVASAEPISEARKTAPASTIKVDTTKLDNLVDMVGEMVIAQSMIAQDADLKALGNPKLTRNLAQLARVTKELQRSAMSLRMVPVRGTFQKMTRLVRDLSARAGKQVELIISGEETELDRNIVEELGDPLIHMMRNSVDHGIESPQARQAAGKSPEGKIWLLASHQSGNFVVQIKDDGAGLNRERILTKAIAQGLVQSGAELTDKEVWALIFAPGFSTAEVVTDISGRGVGMDVVRRNIEKLRGKIEIESVPGQGTTFSILLPLTLAIIDGLIVRVGEDRYIIPTLSVRESFRPTREMISTVHERGELVSVRGRLLPLLRLKQTFSGAPDRSDPTNSVVIVVEADHAERCILVDELLGKQEVVIKSLGETFTCNRWMAGAAILGDGRVGLILDVNTLVQPRTATLQKAA
jgi:two-component system, chemotaxis family, sensor kinase CheA